MWRHSAATVGGEHGLMNLAHHVHLVDADAAARSAIARYLESHGLTVTAMDWVSAPPLLSFTVTITL